jgi:hypothetical protein
MSSHLCRAALMTVVLWAFLGLTESRLLAQQPLLVVGHQVLNVQVSNRAITLTDGSLLSLRGGIILNSSITAEGSGMMDILATSPWYGGLGGNITSNATIAFRATASDPSDLLLYGNTTLTGHTTLVTTDTLRNRVFGGTSGGAGKDTLRIPLDSQLTLGGSGQLDIINGGPFSPADEIVNEGTISVLMKLARNDWPISNAGVIEIHDASVFEARRGIANATGDITVHDGGILRLVGGSISGGAVATEGSGKIVIPSVGPFFGSISGNIASDATFSLESDGVSPADLLITGNTTLTGHTTLVTTDTLRNRVYGAGSGAAGQDTLRIAQDSQLTLAGGGQLDIINGGPLSPADEIVNEGTISVLTKLARNDWPINNAGVIEIHGASVFESKRGIANSTGDITIHDGGVLRLVGGSISGGSVTTEGSGKIVIPSVGPFFGSISGNIASDATFSLESDGVSPADLIISATTTLSGETRIVTTDTLRNRVFGTASQDTLTIAPDSRLSFAGSGQLDFALPNQGGLESITNHGAFDVSMKLVKSALTVQNNGEVLIRSGAVLQVGPLTNVNAVLIEDAGRLELSGAFIQHNGETAVDGTLAASTVTLNDGVLSGNGTIMGNVSSLAATVAPGSSPGALHIDGSYTQGAAGSLILEIAGLLPRTEFDQLWVTGNASLAGSIDVVFTDGYLPRVGDVFDLMHVGGTFNASLAQLQVFNVPDVFQYTTAFEGGAYSLTVTAVPEPSSLLLAGLGAAGLAIVARRRARRSAASRHQAEGRY